MRRAAQRTAQCRTGLTLVELLVVLSLIAVLLGMGLGVFANFDMGSRVAVGNVQNVVRSAHNWAVAQAAPSRVRIDAGGSEGSVPSLRAEGLQTVGTWHFESEPIRGAFGHEGASFGGELVDDGFQGSALSFAGESGRARVEFPVHVVSSWSFGDGFRIECAVRPAGGRGGTLLDLGGVVGIETTQDGALKAWFTAARSDDEASAGRGGRVTMSTAPGLLAPGRWSRIGIGYDRHAFRIHVEGQPAAEVLEEGPVALLAGPLVLSPSSMAFPGDVDNQVVAAVVSGDASELPRGITFGKGTPPVIVFQAGGGLDRAHHREAVRLVLDFDDGRSETVLVNLSGTVE